jgi:hypothetical protein
MIVDVNLSKGNGQKNLDGITKTSSNEFKRQSDMLWDETIDSTMCYSPNSFS